MGKSSSFRSILTQVMIVFAFIVFALCYYEYRAVFSVSTASAAVQHKNLREEKVERRLVSVASVTLATVGDITHFSYLYYQVAFWMGPIEGVIAVKNDEAATFKSLIKNGSFPSRVRIHSYQNDMTSFPINHLRNLAYQYTTTTHVLIADIDVFPDPSLYAEFLSLPPWLVDDPKQVVVLPLFETTHYSLPCSNWYDCGSQMNLFYHMKKYDLKMCTLTNGCLNLGLNGANQYVTQKWFNLPKNSLFTKYTCWENTRQQPFVIVRKSKEIPVFYEHLKDFGNNRLEWINHLRFKGFEFNLLSRSWLYHLRHRQSAVAMSYDQKKDVNGKILQIREAELDQLYKGTWRLPLCNNAQEVYSNPTGMTVEQFLERKDMEEYVPQSASFKKDMELAQKFAKKREYLKRKSKKTH